MFKESNTLLTAARRLDKEALTAIYDEYSQPIFKYALRPCRNEVEADQIVGDVFAQVLEQFAAGKGPKKNLRSYLYQTAYHLVIDRSRSNQHASPLELAYNRPTRDMQLEDVVDNKERLEGVINTANNLTDDQRHVLILRFIEGYKLRETAEIIGKDINNIKVIQNRAIAKLRKAFEVKREE